MKQSVRDRFNVREYKAYLRKVAKTSFKYKMDDLAFCVGDEWLRYASFSELEGKPYYIVSNSLGR